MRVIGTPIFTMIRSNCDRTLSACFRERAFR